VSFGKLVTPFSLVKVEHTKDPAGFSTDHDVALYSGRCYFEPQRGNEIWANRAAFSQANALFRFRAIPGMTVDPTMTLLCNGARYNILSAEDVRGRGLYWEILAEKIGGSA
jgi:hypothetical protein